MSPSLFLTVFPSRLQLNSQSWIQVCETAGRKVLYLSQMWNTHSFACWKIWQEIHLSPDWLPKCRPCESTYLNGELANNIFWDLPTNHYYWQHTATDLHLLPHHSHKLPQVAVPKDPFCSQHLRISCPVLLTASLPEPVQHNQFPTAAANLCPSAQLLPTQYCCWLMGIWHKHLPVLTVPQFIHTQTYMCVCTNFPISQPISVLHLCRARMPEDGFGRPHSFDLSAGGGSQSTMHVRPTFSTSISHMPTRLLPCQHSAHTNSTAQSDSPNTSVHQRDEPFN